MMKQKQNPTVKAQKKQVQKVFQIQTHHLKKKQIQSMMTNHQKKSLTPLRRVQKTQNIQRKKSHLPKKQKMTKMKTHKQPAQKQKSSFQKLIYQNPFVQIQQELRITMDRQQIQQKLNIMNLKSKKKIIHYVQKWILKLQHNQNHCNQKYRTSHMRRWC